MNVLGSKFTGRMRYLQKANTTTEAPKLQQEIEHATYINGEAVGWHYEWRDIPTEIKGSK
jgi:hypothetical protein